MPLTNPGVAVPTAAGQTIVTHLMIQTDAATLNQSVNFTLVNTLVDGSGNVVGRDAPKSISIPNLAQAATDVPAIAPLLATAQAAVLQAIAAYAVAKAIPGFTSLTVT